MTLGRRDLGGGDSPATLAQPAIESHEILIVFENWAQEDVGATVEASSTAIGIGEPLIDPTAEKLMTPDLDVAWRSGSLASLVQAPPIFGAQVRLRFNLGSPRTVDWVSLHRGNVRVPIRADFYRADPSTGAAPIFASPWTDPIVRASLRDFGWKDLAWSLGPTIRQLDAWASLFRLDSFIAAPRAYYGVRFVDLWFDVSKGANKSADFLQFAYPIIGRSFRPEVNMVLGWDIGPVDRSETRRVESGAKKGRRKSMGRSFSFTLGYLSRTEAFGRLLNDWLMAQGTLGLAFLWPEPLQRRFFYQTAILGQIESLPRVAMANLEVPAVNGFQIEEAE